MSKDDKITLLSSKENSDNVILPVDKGNAIIELTSKDYNFKITSFFEIPLLRLREK